MTETLMNQQICLITGASRGLGAALAPAFAIAGYHVIAVARTVGGLEAVDDQIVKATGQNATLVPLDIRDGDSIDRMGAALHERFGKLDVVISNAANMGTLSPIAQSNPKPFEDAWRTNCQGPYRLIRSLDPLLRLSGNGRFIGVTCEAAVDQSPFWGAYGASKAAFERMVLGYAGEVTGHDIRVNLIDPGPMATKLRSVAFPGEREGKQPDPASKTNAFVALADAGDGRHGERLVLT
jgi:NAD(P)-dependent dehydrogenase (short-subunit alcohol dehydrogenase family)